MALGDRAQAALMLSAEQARRFRALQDLYSETKTSGTAQPLESYKLVDKMLSALEIKDEPSGSEL